MALNTNHRARHEPDALQTFRIIRRLRRFYPWLAPLPPSMFMGALELEAVS